MDHSSSFDQFYAARGPSLVRALYLATGDLERAEACVQEAFIRAWKGWRKLESNDPVGWVRTVAWRLAIDDWRRTQRFADAIRRVVPAPASEPEEAALMARGLLQLMTVDHAAVAMLYYVDDLAIADIATILDVPEGTIKSRLSTARNKIRERWLTEEEKR